MRIRWSGCRQTLLARDCSRFIDVEDFKRILVGTGKSVGDHVGFAFDVSNVRCVLGYTTELVRLLKGLGICLFVDGWHQRLMVREKSKRSTFYPGLEVLASAER